MRNTSRMTRLIADLLDVQKIQSGMMTIEKSEVEVSALFEEIKSTFGDWLSEQFNCSKSCRNQF